MYKGIKMQAYPNQAQIDVFERTFGCCRVVYNACVNDRRQGKNYRDSLRRLQTDGKHEYLKDVEEEALRIAFFNFSNAIKRGEEPKFKSKKTGTQSYRLVNKNGSIHFDADQSHLIMPGLATPLKVRWSRNIEFNRIIEVTIERTPDGNYYAVLSVEFTPEKRPNQGGSIGIDLSIEPFYTDSNDQTADGLLAMEKMLKRLRGEDRKLTRKQKAQEAASIETHSKNFEKQRKKIACLYQRIVNQRDDYLQKLSTELIRENQVICFENFAIAPMLVSRDASRNVFDSSFTKFRTML